MVAHAREAKHTPAPLLDEQALAVLTAEAEAHDRPGTSLTWANATDDERPTLLRDAATFRHNAEASVARWRDSMRAAGLSEAEIAAAEAQYRAPTVTTTGGGIDAADLLGMDLAPLRWIVPDLLPEGTTILASPPKIGKSCICYQLVVEAGIGGDFLGRRVTPGSALYLALEDGPRRGRDRLRAALHGRTMPRGRVEVRWSAPKIGAGLEDEIEAWLDSHPDAAIVAIDTLGKVRPRTDGRRNAYEVDVEDLGRLQSLFRDRSVALVVVHHARKEVGDDFLASVSGTYGITGSADTIASVRRKRLEAFGTITVAGRDVPDAEIPVRFDGLTWHEAPLSLAEASFERIEVYRAIEADGPLFPAAIAERTGLGRTSVQNMVAKLVEGGAVARTAKGYVATSTPTTLPDDSSDWGSHQSHGGHAREVEADFPASAWEAES